MLILRDMRQSDIEDYVRWFTVETEWAYWDAPWEPLEESNADSERAGWAAYYDSVKSLPADALRWKYEIDWDGVHVGWVCRYTDLEYMDNPDKILAVGIDIPHADARGKGCGTQAMQAFIDYLHAHGHDTFYTQTWSGNARMLRVAEKLGFVEVYRVKDARRVGEQLYDAVTLKLEL